MARLRLLGPREIARRWRDYGRRQQDQLRESYRFPPVDPDRALAPRRPDPAPRPADSTVPGPDPAPVSPHHSAEVPFDQADDLDDTMVTRFGEAGRPFNRHSPFYLGFVGATGALLAIFLWSAVGRLATTITILVISLFLTLALNPIVEILTRRGARRSAAVTVVFTGLLIVFTLLGFLVVPPVVTQGAELAQRAPGYLQHALDAPWVQDLDQTYGLVDRFQEEFTKRITDQTFIQQVLGGILGAGRIVVSGVFQTLTVLILTLYFLASLPRMKQGAYAIVPASRRTRTVSLSEEIMRRVGSYAIGQVAVATLNATCSWVMMTLLGIPYAAVLAVMVGFLGLIPMIGATIGAILVSVVAFFIDPHYAIVTIVYYVIYQQLENYVVMPRIMQRTVSVPGAVTVVAALIGGTLLGVLGALLAIPVAAGLLLIYDEVLVPRQARQ